MQAMVWVLSRLSPGGQLGQVFAPVEGVIVPHPVRQLCAGEDDHVGSEKTDEAVAVFLLQFPRSLEAVLVAERQFRVSLGDVRGRLVQQLPGSLPAVVEHPAHQPYVAQRYETADDERTWREVA